MNTHFEKAISTGTRLWLSGVLAAGLAAAGISIGVGTASAACVAYRTVTDVSNPASTDCDGIQHGQLSGETRGHVDGHGWTLGQGVEDLSATQVFWRSSILGEVRGPCIRGVTCH